jgi:4-amino-4-deoxy-L-arabinose transferase-like glycosyltransferase
MALGTLAKGPVAPFLAFLIIAAYAGTVRDPKVLFKTIWLPGILLFGVIALPWYFAVQARHPEFFREFILEHNLGRFSKNLYHHTQPFWYYLPVTALALVPWVVFVSTAFARAIRVWRIGRRWIGLKSIAPPGSGLEYRLSIFFCCWLIVPVVFFSISQSKLPGYILPAIPAGAVLLADYLRHRLEENNAEPAPTWLVILHALIAAAPIVPALLIAYLITQHRLPGGRPMQAALAVAFVLCAGIALTLVRKNGLRMMRFVTLIPVVLAVGAVLKLGSGDLDATLSARPLAQEVAAVEMRQLPLAVYHVRREMEYGLTFYRNRLTFNYDWGSVPREEHLVIAPENSQVEIAKLVAGRRVTFLGHYAPQHVDYFWVAAAPRSSP